MCTRGSMGKGSIDWPLPIPGNFQTLLPRWPPNLLRKPLPWPPRLPSPTSLSGTSCSRPSKRTKAPAITVPILAMPMMHSASNTRTIAQILSSGLAYPIWRDIKRPTKIGRYLTKFFIPISDGLEWWFSPSPQPSSILPIGMMASRKRYDLSVVDKAKKPSHICMDDKKRGRKSPNWGASDFFCMHANFWRANSNTWSISDTNRINTFLT